MGEKEIQKILDELQGVRPEMLTGEAKRLFEAIMKIADQRDEYKKLYEEERKENTDFQSCWVHIDDYLKLKRQTEMTAKEFGDTLDRLNKMIDLLIEDLQSEVCLVDMTNEEIYRFYEKRVEIERKNTENEG